MEPLSANLKQNTSKIRLTHFFAILFSAFILCFIAIYNSYPLTFNNDTGAYVEAGFNKVVSFDRPILYGLFIYYSSFQKSLWLVVITQSLIVSVIIYYYFRYTVYSTNFIPYFIGFIVVISFFMGGSFEVSWLMPDVFTPVSILCVGLLIFINDLKKRDILIISLLAILSNGVHNSHIYICLCLSFLFLSGFIFKQIRQIFNFSAIKIKRVIFVLLLSVFSSLMLSSVHYLYGGGFSGSRGGSVFLMSNLVEMGIMDTYLAENCSQKHYKLCAYRDSIPNNFLWAENSPINKTGGWIKNEAEYSAIVKDILTTPKYLATFIYQSCIYTFKQFFNYDMVDIALPSERIDRAVAKYQKEYLSYLHARQSTNRMSFGLINFIQNLIVGLCLFIYLLVFLYKKMTLRYRVLIFFVLSGLFINAWICSTFSCVSPRYQTRVIWLLLLPLFLYVFEYQKGKAVMRRIKSNLPAFKLLNKDKQILILKVFPVAKRDRS
ncbi:hypothetical protein [Mucilaginibacter sp.]|uniref:hypothetical protein n=1 Tax=Mucilaginibacter sp. TaxID=1882438 RepID=UPI002ED29584